MPVFFGEPVVPDGAVEPLCEFIGFLVILKAGDDNVQKKDRYRLFLLPEQRVVKTRIHHRRVFLQGYRQECW